MGCVVVHYYGGHADGGLGRGLLVSDGFVCFGLMNARGIIDPGLLTPLGIV